MNRYGTIRPIFMKPESLEELEALFHSALECPENERADFINRSCLGNAKLRGQLEALLAQHSSSAMGGPAIDTWVGKTVNHYRIEALVGSGGMAEVYRAHDTKLGRAVAFKVLPSYVAADRDQLSRLQREAHLLASLNHPNIASVYGLEETDEISGIVLEFVDGETLAERIARGPLPIPQALEIALKITEALEVAHDKGIVHRDLKPSNIKIASTGTVKVLDFGIAKMLEPTALENEKTCLGDATATGIILGTATYMSPEQARGERVDKRADVWAFGCVLYEMLAGKKLFTGGTVSDTVAAVLKNEPDWQSLPLETPPVVRALLRFCTAKDPRQRLPHIGAARIQIVDLLSGPPATTVPTGDVAPHRMSFWPVFGIAAVTLIAVIVGIALRNRPDDKSEVRLQMVMDYGEARPAHFSLSPDGRKVVFARRASDRQSLFVRDLDDPASRPLEGTNGANYPFWSPDNRSIAFFRDGKIERIAYSGGPVETITKATDGRGGSWNKDGIIVFAENNTGPLYQVSARGGEPVILTRLAPGQDSHRFPVFLPDGRHFIFFVQGIPEVKGVYLGQLDNPQLQRLLVADSFAVFADDHLFLVRDDIMLAQKFSLARLALEGDPFVVATGVFVDSGRNSTDLSASPGVITYRARHLDKRTRDQNWFGLTVKEMCCHQPINSTISSRGAGSIAGWSSTRIS
jgi:eukaryotic-like serine/threonine-protein kinase